MDIGNSVLVYLNETGSIWDSRIIYLKNVL